MCRRDPRKVLFPSTENKPTAEFEREEYADADEDEPEYRSPEKEQYS